jgi:hypothetical protein
MTCDEFLAPTGLAGAAGKSTAGDDTGVPASDGSRLRVLTALVL